MGRSAAKRQGNVMELSGNFTLSGEWSPCIIHPKISLGGPVGSLSQQTHFFNILLILFFLFCLHQSRHNVFYLSVCSSVRLFVRHQICQHDILKMNEPVLIQIGPSGPHGYGMNDQLRWSGGQRSRSYEADVRFGACLVEVSFWTPWVE